MRADWSVADASTLWDSIRADPECAPRHWCQCQTDGSVLLKDTGTGMYCNELIDGVTFHYQIPHRPARPEDVRVCDRLRLEAEATQKATEVRLFATAAAADHYLGEWVVEECVESPTRTYVVLKRLAAQNGVLAAAYRLRRRARSKSEAQHLGALKRVLPGWHIAHEPETAVGLDAALVSQAKRRAFAGDAYTHDYVAASPRGCKRICVESKANRAGLTDEAKEKCRALRDGALSRVIAVMDHGDRMIVHDFGPPYTQSTDEREFAAAEIPQLRQALGVAPPPRRALTVPSDSSSPSPSPTRPQREEPVRR